MADLVTEMRKNPHLKRSKSVRASLRFIGARFLHKHQEAAMVKTPSMSSLHEYKRNFFEYSLIPEVETILKTPMVKEKKKKKVVSTPPPVVAPKAAQILQIPVKENYEPVSLQPDGFDGITMRNGVECHRQGRFQEFGYDYRQNGFYRNTLRLSMTTSRRRNTLVASTSSR